MYFDYYSVKTFMSDIMESFIDKTLQLITLERDAETLESLENVSKQMECLSKLESHGICLSRLHVHKSVYSYAMLYHITLCTD